MLMKKIYYWLIGILLLLVVTNPSIQSFNTYLAGTPHYTPHRPLNLLIVSVYVTGKATYLGVLGNFIHLDNNSPTFVLDK
nr:hypothetical protein [Mucilaginibacter sp. X4EP1]